MMITDVCEQFGLLPLRSVSTIDAGLINSSFKITTENGNTFFLQRINTLVFEHPADLQQNYYQIHQHLAHDGSLPLPEPVPTIKGDLFCWINKEAWRCFLFVENAYSPSSVHTPEAAYEVAHCFGTFTALLQSLDTQKLKVILPRFHDLHFRYYQFLEAKQNASAERLSQSIDLCKQIEQQHHLVDWYQRISEDKKSFPLHILHHDCKISNILFDKITGAVRCPIDLDTTQPGLFFSDIGDMMRTMVSATDENDTSLDHMQLRPEFFNAILQGYLDAMSHLLTADEQREIVYSGNAMIYMQAIRFLTDFLNGDRYYKTTYPMQNKDRVANQLRLLSLMMQHTDTIKTS